MAGWGLSVCEVEEITADVWPDHWIAYEIFDSMGSQWRMGMGGASGLDYTALHPVSRMLGYSEEELNQSFYDIRYLEGSALKFMAMQRNKN